jgi:hypothetical protein
MTMQWSLRKGNGNNITLDERATTFVTLETTKNHKQQNEVDMIEGYFEKNKETQLKCDKR